MLTLLKESHFNAGLKESHFNAGFHWKPLDGTPPHSFNDFFLRVLSLGLQLQACVIADGDYKRVYHNTYH